MAVTIADISTAGNPLIFVNDFFTKVSGYEAHEAHGRNCRFLQGDGTSMSALLEFKEQLRNMNDAFVRLTNYRKSGEAFENLLATRCVRDEAHCVRFCICLALPVDERIQLKDELSVMARIFAALPHRIGEPLELPNGSEALSAIDGKLIAAMAEVALPTEQSRSRTGRIGGSNHKPLIAFSPSVGVLRSTTELMRLHWAHLEPEQVCAMLSNRSTRERLLWYVHVRSPEEEETLREFLKAKEITKNDAKIAQSEWRASTDVIAQSESLAPKLFGSVSREECAYLERLHAKFVVPFVHTDSRLGELVSATASVPSLGLFTNKGWLAMLRKATENLPFAVIASDMFEPGAKLVSVNAAFEQLTGYEREEVLGRNCRFLQGEETEQDAVQQLVDALREARPVQVELTNYRNDGAPFRNLLSLRPVHDSNGRYRYCIGILADATTLAPTSYEEYTRIIEMLPVNFEASLSPLPRPVSPDSLPEHPPSHSVVTHGVPQAKLELLATLEETVVAIINHKASLHQFREHVHGVSWQLAKYSQAEGALDFLLEAQAFHALPQNQQRERVHKIFDKYGGRFTVGKKSAFIAARDALAAVHEKKEESLRTLAECLPGFIASPLSDQHAETVPLGSERAYACSCHRLWREYHVPVDQKGWLFSIVSAVEKMDVSVSISDMRVAGNPLVYVNQAFCRMTGYSKSEILGRNCRFLQGPETEVESVSALVDALRHGSELSLKLVNYHRNGEPFENLLSLRPVFDSNGVYCYVIAIQLETSGRDVQLELYAALLHLLPSHIEVGDAAACGPMHLKAWGGGNGGRGRRLSLRSGTGGGKLPPFGTCRERLSRALQGAMPNCRASDVRGVIRYAANHEAARYALRAEAKSRSRGVIAVGDDPLMKPTLAPGRSRSAQQPTRGHVFAEAGVGDSAAAAAAAVDKQCRHSSMGSVSCGATPGQAHTCVEEDVHSDVSSLVETAPAAGAAVPLGTFTKDPGHTMLAAAAVASPEGGYGFVADAAIMYTKLMWLSHRSPGVHSPIVSV